MSPKHAWEQVAGQHPWEQDGYDPDPDSDQEPLPEESPDAAAREFLELLVDQYLSSTLSAKTFCNLCYYAHLAGMPGKISAYAMKPGCNVGNYQRKLDVAFGFDIEKKNCYVVPAPCSVKGDASRTVVDLPTRPPHELLAEEVSSNGAIPTLMQEMIDAGSLPESYFTNPVVQRAEGSGARPLPVGLYMDGVPYTLTDTVVAIWLINLVTGARHVAALVRKSIVCECGCRGRCTFWPILRFLLWSIRVMSQGFFPDHRHDEPIFRSSESFRQELAGKPLGYTAAVVWLKGDWAEFCERYGFPGHRSNLRPCFCCNVWREILYDASGVSLLDCPWVENTDADYSSAADLCERTVTLGQAEWQMLVAC